MEQSEKLSFRRSRKFSSFAIIWFLIILGCCQFGLWSTIGTLQQADGLWVGLVGSFISGALICVAVKEAFSSGAYLTMDDEGIRVPSTGIEIFRWEDIDYVCRRDLTSIGIKTHELADLYLCNYDDYDKQLSGLKKYTKRIDRCAGLNRFSLFLTSLDGEPDLIFASIEERIRISKKLSKLLK